MDFVLYIFSNMLEVAGLIISFIYVLKTGKYIKGVFIGWGLSVMFIFIDSVIIPGILGQSNIELIKYFPDAIAVLPIILLGWSLAIAVSAIAYFIRWIVKKIKRTAKN
jgi:hypothetical protein